MPMSTPFENFLTAFCAADEDLDAATQTLRQYPDSAVARQIRTEIDTVIRDHLLTPSDARRLMARTFRTSAEAAEWLAARRSEWFRT
ncbi:hypothetical protein OG439_46190 [Amycolatopsis sp. NBC_01307]|uniref:hypothetical protein n=1 Tax=Amycolatopsis sp. NBC_01307 TaxID=2903561 RepID=UPI002E150549|nr:hypothetical protein OG439_46190 [Amycolatopsis sp. NBC_01307]